MVGGLPLVLGHYAYLFRQLESRRIEDGQDLTLMDKARTLLEALPGGFWQALAIIWVLYMTCFETAFITMRASSVNGPAGAAVTAEYG